MSGIVGGVFYCFGEINIILCRIESKMFDVSFRVCVVWRVNNLGWKFGGEVKYVLMFYWILNFRFCRCDLYYKKDLLIRLERRICFSLRV